MKHRSSSTLVLLVVTVFSVIHLTSANKTVPCEKTGCKEDKICHLTKCIEAECRTKPCVSGYYCDDHGKCIKDTPCDKKCDEGEECYLQPVQCFVAPCPPVPSCRPDKCASVRCYNEEICENGECVLDNKCAVTLCPKGTYCYKGSCLSEVPCEEGQCGPAQKCYIGNEECDKPPSKVVCRDDKCAIVRCRGGHKCVDGKCIPMDDSLKPNY